MKRNLMRVINANVISKFIKTSVVVLLLTGAVGAHAASVSNDKDGIGKTVVTYVSADGETLSFDVKVSNAAGEKFTIVVKDDNGITLYRGSFTDKDFKKRFVLPKTDSNKLTFQVKSESENKSESFEINSNTRIIEEVVVKRVG